MQLRKIQLALAVLAGMLLTTAVVKSQMPTAIPAVGPVWEYATVDTYNGNVPGDAVKLGQKGWELAAVSDHVMYFKRLKSTIHRNE